MITLSKKRVDRSITILSLTIFVLAATLMLVTLKANHNLNTIKEDLLATASKLDKINSETWLLGPQYDVWIAGSKEASNLTNDILTKNSLGNGISSYQYTINRPKMAPLMVYYLTKAKTGGSHNTSEKSLQLTDEGKATIDSVLTNKLRGRIDATAEVIIVTDQATSILIDSTKDAPIRKVVSITPTSTTAQSTTTAKGRDVKVVEYN